ncbi:SCO2102 family sporulation regulator [Streptomyces sp. NPDC003483]
MGLTVLYIAFGIVALWLLGEVLLQYKARLRYRLLAFVGFAGVVLGVLIPSVIVVGLGAAAFAVGQTYVTLSFRRGFAAGWAVGNRQAADRDPDEEPAKGSGRSKRRRGEPDRQDPALEGSDQEAEQEAAEGARYPQGEDDFTRDDDVFTPAHSDRFMPTGSGDLTATGSTAVYEPQPLPDDTGSYGVYSDAAYAAAAGQPDQAYAAAPSQDQQAYAYDGYSGYDQQQYGYDTGQQQYPAYSDPYIGTQTYSGAAYDMTYGGGDQQYTQQQQGYGQDQYGTGGYAAETPAGGVWVPQQRGTEGQYGGELPPEQQYPYQDNGQGNGNTNGNGNGAGFDEQYRY